MSEPEMEPPTQSLADANDAEAEHDEREGEWIREQDAEPAPRGRCTTCGRWVARDGTIECARCYDAALLDEVNRIEWGYDGA